MKVLIFFDIGGSMDAHIKLCEELFSAAKTEFKHMEFFYFHNCLYEACGRTIAAATTRRSTTWDVLHKFPHDYKVIFVGDATMSPYEITYPGGSVEHWNEEAGAVWLDRVAQIYEHVVWLNPVQAEALGIHALHRADQADHQQPHVPADVAGARSGDEGIELLSCF